MALVPVLPTTLSVSAIRSYSAAASFVSTNIAIPRAFRRRGPLHHWAKVLGLYCRSSWVAMLSSISALRLTVPQQLVRRWRIFRLRLHRCQLRRALSHRRLGLHLLRLLLRALRPCLLCLLVCVLLRCEGLRRTLLAHPGPLVRCWLRGRARYALRTARRRRGGLAHAFRRLPLTHSPRLRGAGPTLLCALLHATPLRLPAVREDRA